jgi:hypothetical protein
MPRYRLGGGSERQASQNEASRGAVPLDAGNVELIPRGVAIGGALVIDVGERPSEGTNGHGRRRKVWGTECVVGVE